MLRRFSWPVGEDDHPLAEHPAGETVLAFAIIAFNVCILKKKTT
jgi:hypothetical protein